LPNKQKEAVYNIISDLIPKSVPKITSDKLEQAESKAYFECTNCGFVEPVREGTLIMRRVQVGAATSSTSASSGSVNHKELAFASELPITRAYVCPNKTCKSHNDHTQREAVIYRAPNSMKSEYVCRVCYTHWM
jgi:hypothetical protein